MPYRRAKKAPYRRRKTVKRAPTQKRIRTIVAKEVNKNHPVQYYDIDVNTSVSTSQTQINLLDFLMQNTGILDSYLQANEHRRLIPSTGTAPYQIEYRKVHLLSMSFRLIIANGESGVSPEDANNIMRIWAEYSNRSYRSTPLAYITDVFHYLDNRQTAKTLYDRTFMLNAIQATTPTDIIIPTKKLVKGYLRLNRRLRCVSDLNGTNWDTKTGSAYMNFLSDSGVTSHPSIKGVIRIFYRMLD